MNQTNTHSFVFASYILCVLFLQSQSVSALSPLPVEPYSIETGENNEFLFVMIPNYSLERIVNRYIDIAGYRYTKSGLYKNDGSGNSIWTIDFFDRHASISKDGQYLVAPANGTSKTIWIYKQGKMIKEISAAELTRTKLSMHARAILGNFESIEHDPDKNLLSVQTSSNDHYVINVSTGNIIKHSILVNPVNSVILATISTFAETMITLKNFRVCSHDNVASALAYSGSSRYAKTYELIGYQLKKMPPPSTAQLWTMIAAKFSDIQHITNTGKHSDETTNIEIKFINGTSMKLFIKNKGLNFCGLDEDRKQVSYGIKDIKQISIIVETEEYRPLVFEGVTPKFKRQNVSSYERSFAN
jgi:hypothetical protein